MAKHRFQAAIAAIIGVAGTCVVLTSGSLALASTYRQSTDNARNGPKLVLVQSQISGASLDPSTGKLKLTGAASEQASADPASSGGDCYVKTEKHRKFKGYKPWHTAHQGKSYIIDWLNQLYSVSDARYLVGEGQTYQVQYCTVGGGNTSNGWHQYFNGNAIFYEAKSDQKIKWRWGTGTSSTGSIKTTLNFSVTKGPVSIGASTTVTPGVGSYLGDFGEDGLFGKVPKAVTKYDFNRVNTYFLSPHNHFWDGTAHFEGNTGQVVYEWSMRYANRHTLYFNDVDAIGGLCGELFGCSKPF